LVLNQLRDQAIAWSTSSFFGAGTVLIGAHDRAVDHRAFVVSVGGHMLKNPFPDTDLRPTAEAAENVFPVPEAFWPIPPGNTSPTSVNYRLHEQAVIRRGDSNRAKPARQHVLYPALLIVA
jgi:hypothetical protein